MATQGHVISLVENALKGEMGAWRNLIGQLSPWALHFAQRRLPRGLDAEDAVQESFLIAFRELAALRDPAAFPAWLASIIVSQCARQRTAEQHTVSLERLEGSDLLPCSPNQDPADAVWAKQLMRACDDALAELPEHLSEVCRLHYRRGLSIHAVAQACGLPEGTVKKRLHTARPLLTRLLAHFRSDTLFRVGYMPVSDHLLAMGAERQSAGRSLPLVSRRYISWAALANDLRHGRLDAAFIMAPLAISLHQSGTQLLYVMDGHHNGSALAVSRNDTRQRCLGLPGEISTHHVLLDRLARDRPEFAAQPTRIVHPSSVIAAMRRNSIGAFFCAEPWSAASASLGVGDEVLHSRDILPDHLCCILAVRRDFALRQSHVVGDYVRTLFAVRDRIRRDTDYGARILASGMPVARDVARQILDQGLVTFDDLAPDSGRMEAFARMALDAGVLVPPLALDGFACRDFLPRHAC
ncbi:MAG: sigma-70 family RNA polymerase sigma factor [Desulfovibrionaceae bacterium]